MSPRLAATVALLLCAAACTPGGGEPSGSPTPSPVPTAVTADPSYADVSYNGADVAYVPGERTLPASAYIQGDGWQTRLAKVAVTREISRATANRLKHRPGTGQRLTLLAAPGHEFLMAWIARGDGVSRAESEPLPGAFEVVVGSRVTALDFTPTTSDVFVVASVPAGADAQLRIVDKGKTSAISLRTGTPVGAEGCRAPAKGTENIVFGFGTESKPGAVSVDVEATQEAFVDGRGWAKPGRCWVTLKVVSEYMTWADYDPLDPYSSKQPSGYSGLEAVTTSATLGGRSVQVGKAYDLPESTKAVRVTVRPRAPRFQGSRIGWWNSDTRQWSDPGRVTFTME